MLGTLYVGTTIVGWGLYGLSSVAMASKLTREGYRFVKNNKSQAEKIVDITKTLFIMLVPGLNLLIGGITIFKFEEFYEECKKDWIKKGRLVKKEEPTEKEESVNIDLQSKDNNNPKRYSELSNEQKLVILEEEKTRLLQEKANKDKTEPYNYRGAYRK